MPAFEQESENVSPGADNAEANGRSLRDKGQNGFIVWFAELLRREPIAAIVATGIAVAALTNSILGFLVGASGAFFFGSLIERSKT